MRIERRALVAFVLSMALFLAYDAIYLSPRMKKEKARQAALADAGRRAQPDTIAAAAAEAGLSKSAFVAHVLERSRRAALRRKRQ